MNTIPLIEDYLFTVISNQVEDTEAGLSSFALILLHLCGEYCTVLRRQHIFKGGLWVFYDKCPEMIQQRATQLLKMLRSSMLSSYNSNI